MHGAMKALLAAGVLAAFLLMVPAAKAEEVTRLDRSHGVRFTLDGQVLTVRLVPQAGIRPPDVRRDVWGKRTRVACSPVFAFRRSRVLRVAVRRVQSWPEGQLELSYRFARDISDRVKWCLLEDASGGDIAGVHFAPFIRAYGGTAQQRRQARRIRRHLQREAAEAPWLSRVDYVLVAQGGTLVKTDLPKTRRGRQIAGRLCRLIDSSGVESDRSPLVLGRTDVTLRVC
jgi:hypothetical protein